MRTAKRRKDASARHTAKIAAARQRTPDRSGVSSPATAAKRDPGTLVNTLRPGQTPEAAVAEMMVEGMAMNAVAAVAFTKTFGEVDITESMVALGLEAKKVQDGSLSALEATLTAQAVTLNAMFTQLGCFSAKATLIDHVERFMRLALKAQSQCRTTVETLALIKAGPRNTVFARQANIATGPQQVNNVPGGGVASARAKDEESAQIRLLEAHGDRLDQSATGESSLGDPELATVGALNGAAHGPR